MAEARKRIRKKKPAGQPRQSTSSGSTWGPWWTLGGFLLAAVVVSKLWPYIPGYLIDHATLAWAWVCGYAAELAGVVHR